VSAVDEPRRRRGRLVVRVRGVRSRGDDRSVITEQLLLGEAIQDESRQLVLCERRPGARALPRGVDGIARDLRDRGRRAPVRLDVRRGPRGVKAVHQLAGRDNRGARVLHHLEYAGRHAIEIRHGVSRRILHRDLLSFHELADQLLERSPRAVALARPFVGPAFRGPLLVGERDRDVRALAGYGRGRAGRGHGGGSKRGTTYWI